MCRWLTYMGEPIFLDQLIYEPENSLIQQSMDATEGKTVTNGDGFGIGWYGGRETPGQYREILPAWNDENLCNIAHQIRSPLFLAHVRASTGTSTSRANCHPFRLGKWLFMHNGSIGGFARIRRQIEALLSDDLYAQRVGTTDSEAFFLLLAANGMEEDAPKAFEKSVGQVLGLMRAADIKEGFRMTAALTDGQTLYALRYSSRAAQPTLYWRPTEDSLLVVSEPLDEDASHWQPVDPSTMLISAGHGDAAVRPFTPLSI